MLCYAFLRQTDAFRPQKKRDGRWLPSSVLLSRSSRRGGGCPRHHDPDARLPCRLLSAWGEGSTSLLVLGELASPTDGESPKGRAPDLTSGAVGEPLLRTLLVPGP